MGRDSSHLRPFGRARGILGAWDPRSKSPHRLLPIEPHSEGREMSSQLSSMLAIAIFLATAPGYAAAQDRTGSASSANATASLASAHRARTQVDTPWHGNWCATAAEEIGADSNSHTDWNRNLCDFRSALYLLVMRLRFADLRDDRLDAPVFIARRSRSGRYPSRSRGRSQSRSALNPSMFCKSGVEQLDAARRERPSQTKRFAWLKLA